MEYKSWITLLNKAYALENLLDKCREFTETDYFHELSDDDRKSFMDDTDLIREEHREISNFLKDIKREFKNTSIDFNDFGLRKL